MKYMYEYISIVFYVTEIWVLNFVIVQCHTYTEDKTENRSYRKITH